MLLSERNPEPNRRSRTRVRPMGGRIRPAATRSKGEREPEERAHSFSARGETQREKITLDERDDLRIDPLYLFACGLWWQRGSDPTAGWELVGCLRSTGQTARIAAALLARAEDIRPPLSVLMCAIGGPGKPSSQEEGLQKSAGRGL